MKAFVTGTAGFIGFHLASRLLRDGHQVFGFDGMTEYYDPRLKRARLALLLQHDNYTHTEAMLQDAPRLLEAYERSDADLVFHFAAQPGVRYSIENPDSYIQSNIVGTASLLEALRKRRPAHLIFASTSSIYGGNAVLPYAETDRADSPVSLYAATKKSGEAMIHSYSHLWDIPSTCVRFFTVYGPWSRPDMAMLKFAKLIAAGEPIEVYGEGRMRRDFTFVDDLIDAIVSLVSKPPVKGAPIAGVADSLSAVAPFRIVNAGGGKPAELMTFIETLERAMRKTAQIRMLPMQPGDVVATEADTALLEALIGHAPQTPIDIGVERFVEWFNAYSARND